jgi:hypothetical protein
VPPARRLSPVFDALGCWAVGKEFQLVRSLIEATGLRLKITFEPAEAR